MCEAWEDILLEMDSKLLKFAEEKRVRFTIIERMMGDLSSEYIRIV